MELKLGYEFINQTVGIFNFEIALTTVSISWENTMQPIEK